VAIDTPQSDISHEDVSTKSNRYPQNLIDSTVFIAIISAMFYIFSFGYYKGFFERLSIPYKALDLPITFYLSIGYIPSIIFLLIIIFVAGYFYLGSDEVDLNKTYIEVISLLKLNARYFIILIILCIISYCPPIKSITIFESFFKLIFIITILYASLIMFLLVFCLKIYIKKVLMTKNAMLNTRSS
jgi:hypothetical protein